MMLSSFVQTGAFVHEIASSSMSPTYRPHVSAAVMMPVDSYVGEGIYLIDGYDLYRCERRGQSVACWHDDPAYGEQVVPLDKFNAARLALVVADITIRQPALMRAVA